MNESIHEPLTVWRFIRRHFVRIVIGAVLVAMVYGALLVWVPYQREKRIAKEIGAVGGYSVSVYAGPNWIPQLVRDRVPFLNRIQIVGHVTDAGLEHLKGLTRLKHLNLNNTKVTDAGLKHLKGLTNLQEIWLGDTIVTDAGLKHLKGLTNLTFLNLAKTQITDAGLEHLKGLTNLQHVSLQNTKVTAEGKAMLRKTLPNCEIYPNP